MEVLDFKREAEQTLDEVRYSLSEGWVSENATRECAYLNLTTREGRQFCIRLSRDGFQVVGHSHGDMSEEEGGTFETIYSLLSHISPSYSSSFSQRLADQLSRLESSSDDATGHSTS